MKISINTWRNRATNYIQNIRLIKWWNSLPNFVQNNHIHKNPTECSWVVFEVKNSEAIEEASTLAKFFNTEKWYHQVFGYVWTGLFGNKNKSCCWANPTIQKGLSMRFASYDEANTYGRQNYKSYDVISVA